MPDSISDRFSKDGEPFFDTGISGLSKPALAGNTTELFIDQNLRVEAAYYKKGAILTGTLFLLGAAAFLAFLKTLISMAVLTVVIGVSITPVGLAAVGLGILLGIALYYGIQYCRIRSAVDKTIFKESTLGPED